MFFCSGVLFQKIIAIFCIFIHKLLPEFILKNFNLYFISDNQIWSLLHIQSMTKPFSVRSEPWTSFDKQSYNIFSDDFVHEKLLTVKANQSSTRGTINLKGQVARKGDSYKTGSEVKLWFPIQKLSARSLFFKSKDDKIKIQYDNGLETINNSTLNSYNLYCSYQSNNQLKDIILKAGVNLLAANFSIDNRVRVELHESGEKGFSTGHKFSWAKNNWSIAAYEVFDWKHSSLINNAFRIGFRQGDNDFFLRAENETTRGFKAFDWKNPDSYYNKFTLDYIRKIDDLTRIGLQTEVVKRQLGKSSLVFQRTIPSRQVGVKAKVSSDKSVALCYQAVLKDYGKWTAGLEVSDIGKSNKTSYGLQLDINL